MRLKFISNRTVIGIHLAEINRGRKCPGLQYIAFSVFFSAIQQHGLMSSSPTSQEVLRKSTTIQIILYVFVRVYNFAL